ncbi:MAG: class I SAM-dependent methyltransferase [Thermodesulfovibrionales bacterium]
MDPTRIKLNDMNSSQDNICFQAEKHDLVQTDAFKTAEEFCQFLMHRKAYEVAAGLANGKVVLDFGCNIGYGTNIISNACGKIAGVDVSSKAIEQARRRYSSDKTEFRVIDGSSLPFSDGCFDMIVSFQVVEHLYNYDSYFAEIKRVLKSDGLVLFTTPNALIRLEPGMKPWNEFHVREFAPVEFEKILRTYFPAVSIRGLFAKEPVYSIEFNRVQSMLNRSKKRTSPFAWLRKKIGLFLPDPALEVLRNMVRQFMYFKGSGVAVARTGSSGFAYSVNDYYYLDKAAENIDQALDLMAACRIDGKKIEMRSDNECLERP